MLNETSDPADKVGQSEQEELDLLEAEANKATDDGEKEAKATPPEKTLIDDDLRAKLKIPEKFKHLEDVVSWGANAEKEMSRVKSEMSKLATDTQTKEELLDELENRLKEKEKKDEISSEEREKIINQFNDDWVKDPLATLNKLFDAFEKRLTDKQKVSEKYKVWSEEEAKLKNEYEDWDTEVRPALAKIAAERPHLQSIEEVLAIYEKQKKASELAAKAESEKKKTEKVSAFSEAGAGAGSPSKSIYDKIANASSLAELDALVPREK